MKSYLLAISSLFLLSACLNTTDKEKGLPATAGTTAVVDSSKFTTIQWIDSSKSMGSIDEGQVLKINYRFKNTGNQPLIIEKVQPGCGCTVADYPKEAIAPGQEAEIKAEFDSHGKGNNELTKKNITVYANTAVHGYTLWFDVTVKKPQS